MTVIDLQNQRQARRRAEFEEFMAAQDRMLAETKRIADELIPLMEQWLEYEKEQRKHRPRGPPCEAPRCRDTITTLHPIPAANPDAPRPLIALCDRHLCAVQGGLRVVANDDDTLTWRFAPFGVAPLVITVRRKRGRRARRPRR